jgi:hypothetical protein
MTALYQRMASDNYNGDRQMKDLMLKVWSPTPWMLDVPDSVDGADNLRHFINNWCNQNLGRESYPLHGIEGNWHRGGVTINGLTWYGFKTKEIMEKFRIHFGGNEG